MSPVDGIASFASLVLVKGECERMAKVRGTVPKDLK